MIEAEESYYLLNKIKITLNFKKKILFFIILFLSFIIFFNFYSNLNNNITKKSKIF